MRTPTQLDHADLADTGSSPTAHLLDHLQLHGVRAFQDEADPRPLPDADEVRGALTEITDAFASMLRDTRLEPDLEGLLWGLTNLFHRRIERLERDLDANERAQRSSQQEQDGSEIRSVELERLLGEGLGLIERRNAFEFMREEAAGLFENRTGSAWRPRAGSLVSHRALTSAVVDSRDFLAARRRAETELLIPKGTPIAFAGGQDCNDHVRIWSVLDRCRIKHPDMVLLHGATPKGAERIAACWADSRKVAQVAFRPDWNRHGKAAPFKRNDALLETLPAGIILFPGSGITDNLADKAKAMGVPVWRCGVAPA